MTSSDDRGRSKGPGSGRGPGKGQRGADGSREQAMVPRAEFRSVTTARRCRSPQRGGGGFRDTLFDRRPGRRIVAYRGRALT